MMSCVDIFVLPYRKEFDGASGPLTEAVVREKMIVSSDHGSLGKIVNSNHLGITFESENSKELEKALSRALVIDFS